MIKKIKGWCHNSATIGFARFLYVAGVVIELAAQAADFLTAIGASALVPPNYVGVYTIAIAGVVELARRRSLKRAI